VSVDNQYLARLDASDDGFNHAFARLMIAPAQADATLVTTVSDILAAVAREGDEAVLRFTNEFDARQATDMLQLTLNSEDLAAAEATIDRHILDALSAAAERIRDFHARQLAASWQFEDADGSVLGQRVSALDRVGIYVPGGKASYPSSVLMNAMPAQVAGVNEIVMVAPAPQGQINPVVLAAASLAGVNEVYTIGGAQAIAALAYGTETIRGVDKIVGPGNRYVAEAKRQVFGRVGIDMVAGPSEILIIADGSVDPKWVTLDLFAQAEHDEFAQAVLVSPDDAYLDAISALIAEQLPLMARQAVIAKSLKNRGALIKVPDLDAAVRLSNQLAPEHLELAVSEPRALLNSVTAAGAIFLGAMSSEALGDYCAGPNHVLPTAGSARFASPLGVYDFQRRSSLIEISAGGSQSLGAIATTLAETESLQAHGLSARARMQSEM
jgi:histidinol dehydrogenase